MVTWINNTLESLLFEELYNELYKRLDEAHLPKDCETRSMSWDEAATLCHVKAEDTDNEITKLIYKVAERLYLDGVRAWNAVEEAKNLYELI